MCWKEAVNVMYQAVQNDSKDAYLYYNYALTLYRAGSYDKAIDAFQTLRQTTDVTDLQNKAAIQMGNAQVRLGEKLQKDRSYSGAILSLERALNHYDESTPGELRGDVKNNRKVAAIRLEQCLMQAGKNYLEWANKAADPYGEQNNLRSALQAYDRVIELNAKNDEAVRNAEEIRKRLAKSLAQDAAKSEKQADEIRADPGQRIENYMFKYKEAVTKLDEALTHAPDDKAIQDQKQQTQNKMSDALTQSAQKQAEKPLEKPKIDAGDQWNLAQAKNKLDEALALNPQNQPADELNKKVSEKLETSYVERGQKALANIDKTNNAIAKLNEAMTAADQFQGALGLNPENKPAQEGLAEANAKLPELFADAGDIEAAKAKAAIAGEQYKEGRDGKPQPPSQQQGMPSNANLQKGIGFLEKADQDYGMALGMTPSDADLQKRAQEVRDMLSAARDQLDQQQRAAGEQPGQEAQAAGQQPGEQPGQQPGQQPGDQPGQGQFDGKTKEPTKTMADLAAKGKPNTGDNFWQRRFRDW